MALNRRAGCAKPGVLLRKIPVFAHPRSRSSFFGITFLKRKLPVGETAEFASAPPGHHPPGSAWWCDRAFQRNPTSRVFATGPASQRAAKPPSHRADEPPSAQAPGIRAPLVRTDPKDRLRRAPRMRSQDSAVSRLSPPLIAHSLTRLAICSGQSHPGFCRRNRSTSYHSHAI